MVFNAWSRLVSLLLVLACTLVMVSVNASPVHRTKRMTELFGKRAAIGSDEGEYMDDNAYDEKPLPYWIQQALAQHYDEEAPVAMISPYRYPVQKRMTELFGKRWAPVKRVSELFG